MPSSDDGRAPWHVLRCEPGRLETPSDARLELHDSPTATAERACTVAAVAGCTDDTGIDDVDWWFLTTVDLAEASVIEFPGLTFPATVFVDGVEVGRGTSMFLPFRTRCSAGSHEICVRFHSLTAWLAVRRPRGRWRSSLVASPATRWARTTLIGRAPVYGPLPVPVGFWRPVVITPTRDWTTCSVSTEPAAGDVRIVGASGADDGTEITAVITDGNGASVAQTTHRVRDGQFEMRCGVTAPELWMPHGYGAPNVYRLTLLIDGCVVQRRTIGFRSVVARNDASGFAVEVNGVAIFCRGATWTPPDPIRLVADRSEIHQLVETFVDAGANMLRIVGGMVYEQNEFWDVCAELGVMVWQDAMLSTFDPPSEQSELIADELSGVLDAISGNPALTIVSGGSETLQRPEMLGLDRVARAIPVVESTLPDRVARHSDVPYVVASPSPPAGSHDLAIRPDTGVAHWFGVGGYLRPVADVRSAAVTFAAECLAFANPPVPSAVERHFGSASVAGHHPTWKAGVPRDRGASWDFEDVRDHYAAEMFGEQMFSTRRIDPERYLELGRLAVAEAMRECFAFWRRSDSGCNGALVLAAKDMCPGAGWGLVDVDGTPKPALAVLKRVWAPITVVISDDGLAGLRIDVHNDTDRPVNGALRLTATRSGGNRISDVTEAVAVPPHSSVTTTDAALTGTFRDSSHAFRFGPASADAIEVVFDYEGAAAPARDALIVTPRGGQLAAGVQVTVSPKDDDQWILEITPPVPLRYVNVSMTGWAPSDDYFHLLADVTHYVSLRRTSGTGPPQGTLDSVDLLSPMAFGAGT